MFYTSSNEDYSNRVLDVIDQNRVGAARLYKDSCLHTNGVYMKNLARLGRDLRRTVLMDNTPAAYAKHTENAIPVKSWFEDQEDRELLDLLPILKALAHVKDVTTVLRSILGKMQASFGIDFEKLCIEETHIKIYDHKKIIGNYEPSVFESTHVEAEVKLQKLLGKHKTLVNNKEKSPSMTEAEINKRLFEHIHKFPGVQAIDETNPEVL